MDCGTRVATLRGQGGESMWIWRGRGRKNILLFDGDRPIHANQHGG